MNAVLSRTAPLRRFAFTRSQSTLRSHWPRLVQQVDAIQNDNGVIPLLPPSHQRVVDRKTSQSDKTAAVLVLLVMVGDDSVPSLVFTQRSRHLSQHAAQISFPGGHREDQDASLVETAIREAKEELYPPTTNIDDVDWPDLTVLGSATPVPSIRGVPVTPILAGLHLDASVPPSVLAEMWPGNPAEVDFVFCASIRDLLLNESTRELKATAYNPPNPEAPIFTIRRGGTDDLTIWGLTAYVLQPLLHQLFQPVFFPEGLGKKW